MTIKLSDYVIHFIAQQGVKYVFALPGGGAMHLIDSLGRSDELEYVIPLHEQAGAIAAQAYGHYTSNLGVAIVTTGPGGTNTITGIAGAWMDSTPVLFVSGQVKRSTLMGDSGVRSLGSQEVDIVSIVRPITKYAVRVMEPETIRYHLEKAVYLARNGRRGPVWIDIPVDVQALQVDDENLEGFHPENEFTRTDGNQLEEQVRQILGLLQQAERPVLLAGYGIQAAEAAQEFRTLADSLGIPLLATWKAIGLIPDEHPLFAGRPGGIGQRGANFTQQNSDLLISIGARLDFDQIAFNPQNFARAAKKVIVDVDFAEIQKLKGMDIHTQVISDAKLFILEMLKQKENFPTKNQSAWIAQTRAWKKKYPVVLPEYRDEKEYVNMYILNEALSAEALPGEVIVPGSSGPCANIMMQAWNVKENQSFVFAPALGAMGFGLPMSIGACLASGRKRTICVNGDGGFQLNIQELETVHRLNLPIKFFYLNNNGYGSIMAMQRSYFEGRYVGSEPKSGLTFPDITKVGQAYGLTTYRIKNHDDLHEKIKAALSIPGPVICDVMVDPMQVQMPRVTSVLQNDGTLRSKPMEDLWPFLDREEFFANMIIPPLPE
jgi:acetolactate synthase-1/2/3 large subunit